MMGFMLGCRIPRLQRGWINPPRSPLSERGRLGWGGFGAGKIQEIRKKIEYEYGKEKYRRLSIRLSTGTING